MTHINSEYFSVSKWGVCNPKQTQQIVTGPIHASSLGMDPIVISHQDIQYTPAVETWVNRYASKLSRPDYAVSQSRIRMTQCGSSKSLTFRVSLECKVPHYPIAVSRVVMNDNLFHAIQGVFETMFTLLARDAEKRRISTQKHSSQQTI